MNKQSDNYRGQVLSILDPYLKRAEIDPADLQETDDLYEMGVFDSLELVEIYATLERDLNLVPTFDGEDEGFTTLGGILRALGAQPIDPKAGEEQKVL